MANLRDIRTRIGSVKNTQQITRAMKMVAAAKLRRAQEGIFATRPYAFKVREIITELQDKVDTAKHPLFQPRETVENVLVVVVTSDRGLAGAFNTNIIKVAQQLIDEQYASYRDSGTLRVMAIGRKAHEYFGKRGYDLVGDYRGVFNNLTFGDAHKMVDRIVEGFVDGTWDEVKVVYNEFKNTISQNRIVEPFLPITNERFQTPVMEAENADVPAARSEYEEDYIFEPSADAILTELVPRFLNFQMWRVLLESNAAEQGARMVAMDAATTNAGELLKSLKLTYNRARQEAITTEILEVAGGAEALQQGG